MGENGTVHILTEACILLDFTVSAQALRKSSLVYRTAIKRVTD